MSKAAVDSLRNIQLSGSSTYRRTFGYSSCLSCSYLRHSGFKSRPFNRLFWPKFFTKTAVLTEVFHTTGSFNWRFSYNRLLWMNLFVPADWSFSYNRLFLLTFVLQLSVMNKALKTGWITEVFHTTGCSEWSFSNQVTEVCHAIDYSDWSFLCFFTTSREA
jgi:hypothetical protein